jgi:hypothetical protein
MEQQHTPLSSQPSASAPETQTEPQSPKSSPEDRAKDHYYGTIEGLVKDARESGTHRLLVDVMAYHLALMVTHHGPIAAGHILERFGWYIYGLAEQSNAKSEAEEARKAGHHPN